MYFLWVASPLFMIHKGPMKPFPLSVQGNEGTDDQPIESHSVQVGEVSIGVYLWSSCYFPERGLDWLGADFQWG